MKKMIVLFLSLISFISLGLGTSAASKNETENLNEKLALLKMQIPSDVRAAMAN